MGGQSSSGLYTCLAPTRTTHLIALVGELSLRDEEFRGLWARAEVHAKTRGSVTIRHPLVGHLRLHYESFAVNASAGLTVKVFHPVAGTTTADALSLLGSLSARDAPTAELPAGKT